MLQRGAKIIFLSRPGFFISRFFRFSTPGVANFTYPPRSVTRFGFNSHQFAKKQSFVLRLCWMVPQKLPLWPPGFSGFSTFSENTCHPSCVRLWTRIKYHKSNALERNQNRFQCREHYTLIAAPQPNFRGPFFGGPRSFNKKATKWYLVGKS